MLVRLCLCPLPIHIGVSGRSFRKTNTKEAYTHLGRDTAVSVLGHTGDGTVDVDVTPQSRQGQVGYHETTGGLADKVRCCSNLLCVTTVIDNNDELTAGGGVSSLDIHWWRITERHLLLYLPPQGACLIDTTPVRLIGLQKIQRVTTSVLKKKLLPQYPPVAVVIKVNTQLTNWMPVFNTTGGLYSSKSSSV